MTSERFYPIGIPGRPWNEADKAQWYESCSIRRSYRDEVLSKLESLDKSLVVEQYGALSLDPDRYPLFAVKSASRIKHAPWALITGGVHGYETSGVQGALAFLAEHALAYTDRLNLLVAPCVNPWGYEVINRWNPRAIDPNRSFVERSPCEESAALMKLIQNLGADFLVHIDLHETTDSDENEFRPALAARDGECFEPGLIPDGFYTVGDSENPQAEFQAAIVAGVEKVTHIAPPDVNGEIIGSKLLQHGVINYPFKALGLCAGVTEARFTTTTEVYPDSSKVTAEICNAGQVAAVRAGLDFGTESYTNPNHPLATYRTNFTRHLRGNRASLQLRPLPRECRTRGLHRASVDEYSPSDSLGKQSRSHTVRSPSTTNGRAPEAARFERSHPLVAAGFHPEQSTPRAFRCSRSGLVGERLVHKQVDQAYDRLRVGLCVASTSARDAESIRLDR